MRHQVIDVSNPLWLQTLKKLRHDIYHLPSYLELESKRTNSIPEGILIYDEENLFFVPYLLRKCNEIIGDILTEDTFDIVSPYGYAGILLNATANKEFINSAMNHFIKVLQSKQICSAFLRLHPIINHGFNEIYNSNACSLDGETVSINLKLSEAEIWQQTRPEHRNKINKCKRLGLTARVVPFEEYINQFNSIYEETMNRVGAKKLYYFGYDYFLNLQNAIDKQLRLCLVELEQEITCAGLFTECCGIVQYHLGGTKTQFLKQAPSKLMFDYVRFWAKEHGNEVLHLGGGVGAARDSLYHFKAGFSKQKHTFITLRMIVNQSKYSRLVQLQAKALNTTVEKILSTNFFPAYRSRA